MARERFTTSLRPDAAADLKWLMETTGLTKPEAVGDAVKLMAFCRKESMAGRRIFSISDDEGDDPRELVMW